MLTPSDITQPGFYWYFDAIGGKPLVVEIGPEDAPKRHLEVRFAGRDDWDMLTDLSGAFSGPLAPPAT